PRDAGRALAESERAAGRPVLRFAGQLFSAERDRRIAGGAGGLRGRAGFYRRKLHPFAGWKYRTARPKPIRKRLVLPRRRILSCVQHVQYLGGKGDREDRVPGVEHADPHGGKSLLPTPRGRQRNPLRSVAY